ncbi:MAG TPA: riboflavin synthase [Solibacterales bacterium]|nr:riboflavin synthase [Bryobacterales bacterium]
MFTGIIEEVGTIDTIEPRAAGSRLRVRAKTVLGDAREGDSISVNGVCLTAVELRKDSFAADVSPETLRASNLGDLRTGAMVNLERPLSPGGRFGGHIVQGHVDATGEFVGLEDLGAGNWWLKIRVPPEIDRYLVYKGSISIDGISLTIASLAGPELAVAVIPTTVEKTALRQRRHGDRVNLEVDVLAKYVEKMLATLERRPQRTVEDLREQGY